MWKMLPAPEFHFFFYIYIYIYIITLLSSGRFIVLPISFNYVIPPFLCEMKLVAFDETRMQPKLDVTKTGSGERARRKEK